MAYVASPFMGREIWEQHVLRPTELPPAQVELLKWIGKQDYAQYGECYGQDLNMLMSWGLVKLHEDGEHQDCFIAKGFGLMYRAVSLTDSGTCFLKDILTAEVKKHAATAEGPNSNRPPGPQDHAVDDPGGGQDHQ